MGRKRCGCQEGQGPQGMPWVWPEGRILSDGLGGPQGHGMKEAQLYREEDHQLPLGSPKLQA